MGLLFLDAETAYSDEYSLKKMTTQQYILDERFKVHGMGVALGLEGKGKWLKGAALEQFLAAAVPVSTVIGHNLHFDASILTWRYGLKAKQYIDTLSLSRAVIGGAVTGHSLDNLAKSLLGRKKGFGLLASKGKWDLSPEDEQTLANYCVYNHDSDLNLTRALYKLLIKYLPDKELPVIDWCIRVFTEPKLILNTQLLADYHAEVQAQKAQALVDAGLENRDMLMSNPQFAAALEALGVPPPMKISPATGKETFAFAKTDEGLKELLEHDDIRVQSLVSARLAVKSTIEETRAASYHAASLLGAWPVDYNYAGAEQSLRFSGANGAGGNPQNLKRGGKLRDAIEAPEGYAIVVGDLAQVELRVTFALAGETEPLERLANGEDLYAWFASLMYGKPINKKDNPIERQVAKSAVLGLGFGMGAKKFRQYCGAQNIKLSYEEALLAVKLYRHTFDRVPRLWLTAEHALALMARDEAVEWPPAAPILTTGAPGFMGICGAKLPGGLWVKYPMLRRSNEGWLYKRKHNCPNIFGSEVIANVVQALACEIFKEKLVEINSHMPVVLASHDEAGALVKWEKQEIGKQIMKKILEKSPTWWPSLQLNAEVGSGKTYGDAK